MQFVPFASPTTSRRPTARAHSLQEKQPELTVSQVILFDFSESNRLLGMSINVFQSFDEPAKFSIGELMRHFGTAEASGFLLQQW
jgi:hypothetical protein